VADISQESRQGLGLLGILCTKVIDYCERERKSGQTIAGEDGDAYYYPPDFLKHRDKLRARERLVEQQSGKSAGVRA
jgi:hypothetical protein